MCTVRWCGRLFICNETELEFFVSLSLSLTLDSLDQNKIEKEWLYEIIFWLFVRLVFSLVIRSSSLLRPTRACPP